jgi:hypothetical protein
MVELLVVMVIIVLLAGAYLGISKKSGGGKQAPTPKAATDKARGVECANNLQQLRALLEMENADKGAYPAALNPNNGMSRCPVSGRPYTYDPQTGRAKCVTPGHETF